MADFYEIVRFYNRPEHAAQIIDDDLTLEQVREHCKNPDTQSRTATAPWAKQLTKTHGEWFDGYRKQEAKRGE